MYESWEYFVDARLRKNLADARLRQFWREGLQRCETGFFDASSHNQPGKQGGKRLFDAKRSF